VKKSAGRAPKNAQNTIMIIAGSAPKPVVNVPRHARISQGWENDKPRKERYFKTIGERLNKALYYKLK